MSAAAAASLTVAIAGMAGFIGALLDVVGGLIEMFG